ncbi:MAG: esterase-like activity of phytase family protein [Hyphomicrobiaceae bacterium]
MKAKALVFLAAVLLSNPALAQSRSARPKMKPNTSQSVVRDVVVRARPIRSFHKDGVARPRIGKLRWRGGLVLSAADKEFGGFSGIAMFGDGRSFIAVSDAGTWLTAKLVYDEHRPLRIEKARMGPLKALKNLPLRRPRDRDAEAVRIATGTVAKGVALISFERNQRIGVFPVSGGAIGGPIRYLRPARRLPANKGLEAIALLPSKRKSRDLVAFAERALDRNGHHRGWFWTASKGRPKALALTNPEGFDITDAAGLPDGSLLLLERRFRWSEGVKMRIRQVPAKLVRSGRVLSGRTLIRADLRYQIDNMEGLAVHVDKRGRSILTIISDDNFNSFLQRTVLLQFEMLAD